MIVKISSQKQFKGNELAKALAEKLGAKNFRYSQGGNNGTLTIAYEGSLKSVTEAIEFGSVQSSDETARTITITIP